jgi:hypothetical protein
MVLCVKTEKLSLTETRPNEKQRTKKLSYGETEKKKPRIFWFPVGFLQSLCVGFL